MDNRALVRSMQKAIANDCRRLLGRELTPPEEQFLASRGGLLALETIGDHVRSLAGRPDELERYLRSES
jgi:hypothetical protein